MPKDCEICGKQGMSPRSYAGHMWIAHSKRVGFMKEYDDHRVGCDLRASELDKRIKRIETGIDPTITDRLKGLDGKYASTKHDHTIPTHDHPHGHPEFGKVSKQIDELSKTIKSLVETIEEHRHPLPKHSHSLFGGMELEE